MTQLNSKSVEAMRRPFKITIVSHTLSNGGAERFVSRIVNAVDKEKFSFHICLMRDSRQYAIPHQIRVTVLDKRRGWHILRTIRRLQNAVDEFKPDIVLGNMLYTSWVAAAAVRNLTPTPKLIARFASDPFHDPLPLCQRPLRPWIECLLRGMDVWVANSSQLASRICHFYGVAPAKVRTLANPIDVAVINRLAAEAPPGIPEIKNCQTIIAVGRLSPEKRFDLLIRAFAFIGRNVKTQLWICGEGTERSRLEALVARNGLSDRVRFFGFCENVYTYMRHADVFALTSDYEGLPNALLEAQALGVPAVSTDCPTGPNEIIVEGETGFLVPCGDAEAVADRLLRLLSDAELRKRMGQNASRRTRENFDVNVVVPQWEALFESLREGVGQCVA